ncbi:hypothetical protein CYANOKiyG1_44510 [Okeania sp. KiyG1]|nr:hypothetical protein CYANOKiyG1_44510 [Okeania sp. KiyG1]
MTASVTKLLLFLVLIFSGIPCNATKGGFDNPLNSLEVAIAGAIGRQVTIKVKTTKMANN